MIRIMLNIAKRDNYVFFDPENRVHLDLNTPIGYVEKVTGCLKRALLVGAVIDIDNETGVEIPKDIENFNNMVLNTFKIVKKEKVVEEVVVKAIAPEINEHENIEKVEEKVETETSKKKSKGGKR